MNVRASHFVRNLRGSITREERLVAVMLAIHADYQTAETKVSNGLLAAECSFKNRETASRIVRRLETVYGIIHAVGHRSGGRTATKYRFTFSLNRDSGITVESKRNRDSIQSRLENSNRDFGDGPTVTGNGSNRDSAESHEGFKEGREGAPVGRGRAQLRSSSSEGAQNPDDDFLRDHDRENPIQNTKPLSRVDQLIEKAKHQLVRTGEDPELVEAALALIDARAVEHHTEPATTKYYVQAYWTLLANANELAVLRFQIEQKHENSREGKRA